MEAFPHGVIQEDGSDGMESEGLMKTGLRGDMGGTAGEFGGSVVEMIRCGEMKMLP